MSDGRLTYQPDVVSAPGETLLDLLEEREISQKELALRMGRPLKTINEIIKGKASITPETALQLEKALGAPASFWIQREAHFREYLARVEEELTAKQWLPWIELLPLKELFAAGVLPKVRLSAESKTRLVPVALRFFGVASPDEWESLYARPQVSYRRTLEGQSDTAAISAWLRMGELEAQKTCCADYNRKRFEQTLREIRSMTIESPEVFQPRMHELCAQAGVVLAFVPAIPKSHVSGVARWLKPNKALIQLSLYGKTNDRFWFTFFHEAGHILKHDKKDVFLDEFSGKLIKSQQEHEANSFAASCLIPPKCIEELSYLRTKQAVADFAARIGIHTGIVVGRLQHEGIIPRDWMNDLKVSFRWIEPADA
jgi:HTH-type transcriptional regulator/antitoxin HigA